jgi:tetratricopeptide (TPR) repeat protein
LPGAPRDLCSDLEHGLEASLLAGQGDDAAALRQLEAMSMRVPYQLAGRSVYFARTRERFMRAQLLERAGRLDEAYDWYASAPYASRLDYVYLAPSHLGRARIRERQGDRGGAAAHYARALELLTVADSGASELRREAMEGVRRTGR